MRPPFPPPLLAGPIAVAYAGLRRTLRLSVDDPARCRPRARDGEALLFLCRHGELLPLLMATEGCGLHILASESPDGELLARVLARRGFGLVRGSASRGGMEAARGVLRALADGCAVGLAVDGPRGPRASLQPGVLRLARAAGRPVVPLRAHCERRWVAPGSWDHFELPLPGSRVRVRVGPALEATDPALEHRITGALDLAGRPGVQHARA